MISFFFFWSMISCFDIPTWCDPSFTTPWVSWMRNEDTPGSWKGFLSVATTMTETATKHTPQTVLLKVYNRDESYKSKDWSMYQCFVFFSVVGAAAADMFKKKNKKSEMKSYGLSHKNEREFCCLSFENICEIQEIQNIWARIRIFDIWAKWIPNGRKFGNYAHIYVKNNIYMDVKENSTVQRMNWWAITPIYM